MMRKLFGPLALFAFLLVLGSASTVMADDWDQKTAFTINQPVSIPGHVVLPPAVTSSSVSKQQRQLFRF